jgi:diamine N-acetyltransferase
MIEFRKITYDNADELLFKLEVAEEQKGFLDDNLTNLAYAYIGLTNGDGVSTYAIYADDVMVGFTIYFYFSDDPDADDRYYIEDLMIDKRFQGKGYGRLAAEKLLAEIKTKPHGPADFVTTIVLEGNVPARKMFESLGFRYITLLDKS